VQNNMKESLGLFDQICNSKWFEHTSMIVFLNKIDLFQAKLKYSSVKQYFPEFKGTPNHAISDYPGDERDYNETSRFFQKKFLRLNKSTEKEVYTHFTNATGSCAVCHSNLDTTILRRVMVAVQDTIMNINFRHLLL
jgi:guanine nucleotide-binding protein subunit alpha, other